MASTHALRPNEIRYAVVNISNCADPGGEGSVKLWSLLYPGLTKQALELYPGRG